MAKLFDPIPLNRSAVEQYDSATGLIAAVEAGRGVALVSLSMKCLTGPRVKLLPIVPAIPSLVVGALTGRTKTALTTRFVAAVKSVA